MDEAIFGVVGVAFVGPAGLEDVDAVIYQSGGSGSKRWESAKADLGEKLQKRGREDDSAVLILAGIGASVREIDVLATDPDDVICLLVVNGCGSKVSDIQRIIDSDYILRRQLVEFYLSTEKILIHGLPEFEMLE